MLYREESFFRKSVYLWEFISWHFACIPHLIFKFLVLEF